MNLEQETGQRFSRKDKVVLREGDSLDFNGATVQLSNCIYSLHQNFHVSHLTEISESSPVDKTAFISQRERGADIASLSSPD